MLTKLRYYFVVYSITILFLALLTLIIIVEAEYHGNDNAFLYSFHDVLFNDVLIGISILFSFLGPMVTTFITLVMFIYNRKWKKDLTYLMLTSVIVFGGLFLYFYTSKAALYVFD